jgi:hypothetical protein
MKLFVPALDFVAEELEAVPGMYDSSNSQVPLFPQLPAALME